jgi:acetylornithine deacetylase/succinyl-diaminopimelate desuccinylase-like protein
LSAEIITPTQEELNAATELLQGLIQIDTSNPPGNEREAADMLTWQLQSAGITPEIVGNDHDRPNIVAKVEASPANRTGPPLVLSSHLDVVPVPDPEDWKYPPFSGEIAEGCVWGRGAIDMKGFATMALTAVKLIKQHKLPITRDVIFVAVSDEEAGTEKGSKWLVENRPDLLDSPEYVLNEVGGFTVHRNGRRFYPVHVAEKGIAWLRLTAKGKPGHSSMAVHDSALSRIGEAIVKISKATLPFHITEDAVRFIEGFSRFESKTAQRVSKLMFSSTAGPAILKLIPDPSQRASIEAILRNTATPTRITGADGAINMIPHTASVDIDGRLIPGQKASDLIAELRKVIGDREGKIYEFEVLRESQGVTFPTGTELYREIESVMGEADPEGHVVPSMIPGFTDSQNYAKLGATCYGFYPLKLDESIDFASMFHGDNERIPIDGFHWGIETLLKVLSKFLVR